MKKTIIATLVLMVSIFTIGFISSSEESKANETVLLPDHVCVFLNGNPVVGAKVTIGPYQNSTVSDGCAGFNIDQGNYCVRATYLSYTGCTVKQFTSSPDYVSIYLTSGNCDCPDE